MGISILLPVLRVAMVCGGAICLLIVVYSGSAASLAVRDWTIFRVLLVESVLIGYLSACTVARFSSATGSELKVQASSRALRYGLSAGLVLAVVLGAVLVYSNPDRALAALLTVVGGMLTYGFAVLIWSAYLGIKLLHRIRSSGSHLGVV
jgi:hypothetical protein